MTNLPTDPKPHINEANNSPIPAQLTKKEQQQAIKELKVIIEQNKQIERELKQQNNEEIVYK